MRLLPASLAAALFAAAVSFAPARTLIYCGALLDSVADAPKKEMTIVVDGERIVSVNSGYTAAASGDKMKRMASSR